MDWDPELDVTLSNGRRVVTFQIAAVAGVREAWAVLQPGALRRVIRGDAAAALPPDFVFVELGAEVQCPKSLIIGGALPGALE
jgi:hypothetical protein